MDPNDFKEYMVDQKKMWIFIGALVIGFVVRLMKDDTKGPSIDPRWRMLLVWLLGVVQFGLNLALQMTPKQAAEYAAISALMAIGSHETIIEWWRNGKELPLPGLMKAQPANDVSAPAVPVPPKIDPPQDPPVQAA